jgi:hypothetical protein
MCDRYSSRYGYLCGDCFAELVDKGDDVDIDDFLHSEPSKRKDKPDTFKKWDDEFSIG